MRRARVLLVGDNDDFLDGVVDWLVRDGQFEVVGRAHSGSETLDRIEALRADVVLMDVTLPDMSGFDVARRIKSRDAAPLLVLLSFHDNHVARLEAWAAGADGFVPKPETTTRLIPLVRELLRQRSLGFTKPDSVTPSAAVPPEDRSK